MFNSFPYFTDVIKREATRIYKDPVTLFVSFVAPAFGIIMLWWIFSAGVIRDLPIAIVNQDNTALSDKVARMVEASPTVHILEELSDLSTAKSLMNRGKIKAIIVIPADFEKDLIQGTSPTLAVYIDNVNVVAGGVLKSSIQKTLSTFTVGAKMQLQMKKGYTEQQALARVMPIRFDNHVLFNPYINYSYFLTLGLIPLIVVVVCFLGTLYAFGSEIKEGTAKELMNTANGNIYTAIIGKMLPHTFIYLLSMRLVSLVMIHKIGLPMHGNIWIILFSETALIFAYQSVALVFIAITSNMRLSLSLGSAYTMMAMTFSGLTFPAIAMPKIAQILSYAFPFTFWLKIFMNETLRTIPHLQLWSSFLALFVFISLSLLTFNKLNRIFTQEKFWGKS